MAMPAMMVPPSQNVLSAFARAALSRPGVLAVYAVVDGQGDARVMVLLDRWDRGTRFGVYEAQEEVDPLERLHVSLTDRAEDIPQDATRV